MDDTLIFYGEIARASGDLQGTLNSFGDVIYFNIYYTYIYRYIRNYSYKISYLCLQTILFTTDENILEMISTNDEMFTITNKNMLNYAQKEKERPATVTTNSNVNNIGSLCYYIWIMNMLYILFYYR